MAATDSGEAQTVPRLTKMALVISRETCCDSVKNIVQIEFPLRNGRRALRTKLIPGYRWSALDKTLLLELFPGSR